MTRTATARTTQPTLLDLLQPTTTRTSGSRPAATPTPVSSPPRQTWLAAHLIRTGHLTESGLSRRARLRRCPDCAAITLAGLDADQGGFEAAADPIPLTGLGEMLALLDRLATYELWKAGAGYELERRNHHRITYRPAEHPTRALRVDVLRAHRCHNRAPSDAETATTAFAEARPTHLPLGAPAPF